MDKNEQCEINRVQAIEVAVLYVPLVTVWWWRINVNTINDLKGKKSKGDYISKVVIIRLLTVKRSIWAFLFSISQALHGHGNSANIKEL